VFRAILNTFLKNDLDLAIFDKKIRNFFPSKVFSRPLRHIEPKKNQKKNSFQKVDGSPWIDPYVHYKEVFFYLVGTEKSVQIGGLTVDFFETTTKIAISVCNRKRLSLPKFAFFSSCICRHEIENRFERYTFDNLAEIRQSKIINSCRIKRSISSAKKEYSNSGFNRLYIYIFDYWRMRLRCTRIRAINRTVERSCFFFLCFFHN